MIVNGLLDTNYKSTLKIIKNVTPNEEGVHKKNYRHQTARAKDNGQEHVKYFNPKRI